MFEKRELLFIARKTNLFKVATLPVRLCTSLDFIGDHIYIRSQIFSRFTSMPCYFTINPKDFPHMNPEAYFSMFSSSDILGVC